MNLTPSNPNKSITATFTGHRPNKLTRTNNAYQAKHYEKFQPMLANALEGYLNIGITHFITGGAQGFDQLVFWAVHELKERHPELGIQNIVYVPFHGQESIWRGNDIFGPNNYRKMLSLADDIQYCTDLDNSVPKDEIAKALNYRNHCMCNSASRLCALWSENEYKHGKLSAGGTANCVSYAKNTKMACDQLVYGFDENGRIILV